MILQLRDQDSVPQGGHVFEAPDQETLFAMVDAMPLPVGWTASSVHAEEDIIAAPEPPPEP